MAHILDTTLFASYQADDFLGFAVHVVVNPVYFLGLCRLKGISDFNNQACFTSSPVTLGDFERVLWWLQVFVELSGSEFSPLFGVI